MIPSTSCPNCDNVCEVDARTISMWCADTEFEHRSFPLTCSICKSVFWCRAKNESAPKQCTESIPVLPLGSRIFIDNKTNRHLHGKAGEVVGKRHGFYRILLENGKRLLIPAEWATINE